MKFRDFLDNEISLIFSMFPLVYLPTHALVPVFHKPATPLCSACYFVIHQMIGFLCSSIQLIDFVKHWSYCWRHDRGFYDWDVATLKDRLSFCYTNGRSNTPPHFCPHIKFHFVHKSTFIYYRVTRLPHFTDHKLRVLDSQGHKLCPVHMQSKLKPQPPFYIKY